MTRGALHNTAALHITGALSQHNSRKAKTNAISLFSSPFFIFFRFLVISFFFLTVCNLSFSLTVTLTACNSLSSEADNVLIWDRNSRPYMGNKGTFITIFITVRHRSLSGPDKPNLYTPTFP
jgi:hypothetical protein